MIVTVSDLYLHLIGEATEDFTTGGTERDRSGWLRCFHLLLLHLSAADNADAGFRVDEHRDLRP